MKVYLSHASNYDYRAELYEPLRQALAQDYSIYFPHDPGNVGEKSKEALMHCDIVLAEVSRPSTGQGIELGWAEMSEVPIVCFYLAGSQISSALRFSSDVFIEYDSQDDMVEKLSSYLRSSAGGLSG